MKCPRCGKENKEGAKFCGYCGGALEKSPEPDIPPASVSLPRGGKKEKKNGVGKENYVYRKYGTLHRAEKA